MSYELNLVLHFYVFVGVGFLHNNSIIHSTVFDQSHHPFYCLWPNQSSILPCLTYYIMPSAVFNESYHPIYGFVEVWILTCKSELVALLTFGMLLCLLLILTCVMGPAGWSQWPRGLRCRSAAACLLRLWVRIPHLTWDFVCCECCILQGRGLWTSWLLVQRSPDDCDASLCVI